MSRVLPVRAWPAAKIAGRLRSANADRIETAGIALRIITAPSLNYTRGYPAASAVATTRSMKSDLPRAYSSRDSGSDAIERAARSRLSASYSRDTSVMLTQVVPERQRPALLAAAGLHDVDVVRMRPHGWPVEERAYRIVLVRHMDVPEREERGPIRFQGLQGGHGDLDVDDRLGGETRDCR